MPLGPGTRIGAYTIISQLGAGGMGEVYRARETRLDRDVALKTLPESFAGDAERFARFEREAKTLASLNHPNIAHVYGFEHGEAATAMAMELVEGADLAERVALGALPLGDVLAIADQIADALAAAHAAGVVHRDLKPANIKMRDDGSVKVLDFGLAKAVDAPAGARSGGPRHDMTISAMTGQGVVLGTAAYMSPEQARAKPVDARTDIWAFGCVVYELLTARPAFGGESTTDVLAAVVTQEPDWSALPPETPPPLRRLLQRCLAKDPRRRLQHIGDARLDLEEARGAGSTAHALSAPEHRSRGSRLALVATMAVIAVASFVGGVHWAMRGVPPPRERQLQRVTEDVGLEESSAISPDGRSIAYLARVGDHRQVWVRLLTGGTPLRLTQEAIDHQHPRWTSDSSAVLYFTSGQSPGSFGTLWEVPALGGTPRRLMNSSGAADVSPDGARIATFRTHDGQPELIVSPRDGTSSRTIVKLPGGAIYSYPRWSPDGSRIALQQSKIYSFDKRILVVDAGTGATSEVARADHLQGLTWFGDGSRIVYSTSRGSTVLYPPVMNLRTISADGTDDRDLTFGDISFTEPDARGMVIAATRARIQSDVWRIPIDLAPAENVRRATRLTRQTGMAQVVTISPDESEVAFLSDTGGHGNLWTVRSDGSRLRQLTFEQNADVSVGVAAWSPVSNQIALLLTRGGTATQWLIAADGSSTRELVRDAFYTYWSPDGRWLYYVTGNPGRIEKIDVASGQVTVVRTDDPASPAVASDGTLYFTVAARDAAGSSEWTIRKAQPENGPAVTLARVSSTRIPVEDVNIHPILSPNGAWLAQPLIDGATSNLWLVNTQTGALQRVTDFGRATIIARRVAWSRDSRAIYAAVADVESDVVLLKQLVQ